MLKVYALILTALPNAALQLIRAILADAQAVPLLPSAANLLRELLLMQLERKKKLKKWWITIKKS